MGMFQEIFEAYGADYEKTMRRVMHSEQTYLRLLDMLLADKTMDTLDGCLQAKDFSGAFAAAHTLKGMTGNMGLTPLYEDVCALVEALRGGTEEADYTHLYSAVQSGFKAVQTLREELQKAVS